MNTDDFKTLMINEPAEALEEYEKLLERRDTLLAAARRVRPILAEAQYTGTYFGEDLEADRENLKALDSAIAVNEAP
jgi:hypothetical protein